MLIYRPSSRTTAGTQKTLEQALDETHRIMTDLKLSGLTLAFGGEEWSLRGIMAFRESPGSLQPKVYLLRTIKTTWEPF